MMRAVALSDLGLHPDDEVLLAKIADDLPILSDMCRGDLLLYGRLGGSGRTRQAVTVAQCRPHSFTPLWEDDLVGRRSDDGELPVIVRRLAHGAGPLPLGERWGAVSTVVVHGMTVAREIYPVYGREGSLIAVLSRDSFWLAHERHLRRNKVFQQALEQLVAMTLRGELCEAGALTPFGANDGIMFVNGDRRVAYMSGIASALYQQIGYHDGIVGRRLGDIEPIDRDMVSQAMAERCCRERTSEQGGLTWNRKVLPLTGVTSSPIRGAWRRLWGLPPRRTSLIGAFELLHDETEQLRREAELESQMAMVREVHHRVKNNLTIIASLMRMQARRVEGEEARRVLEESVKRISSVAVVHEFLSHSASQGTISLQEVTRRIVSQIRETLVDPDKRLSLTTEASDTIWLPAESATRCALVVNELVQNAVEHGMADREQGAVSVALSDDGNNVTITVSDDGVGLPPGFSLDEHSNLGLQIVRSMVERDLRGRFALYRQQGLTRAMVSFVKSL